MIKKSHQFAKSKKIPTATNSSSTSIKLTQMKNRKKPEMFEIQNQILIKSKLTSFQNTLVNLYIQT
jgi:hypothetical protein